MKKTLFQYLSARRFLIDSIEARKKADRSFSIRKWAKEIGMGSHTLLVMILQGKRTLTLKQAPAIAKGLGLTTPERMYFQCLIQYENASSDEEREMCRLWMSDLNPGANATIREVDQFLAISHWIHMALLAMSETKEGIPDPETLARRLRFKVSAFEIRGAIERLKSLGLLRESGGRLVCSDVRITTKDDVANRGAREYYKQVSTLAQEAVESVPLDRREFQGFAVAVPRSKIAFAKEQIRKFRTQFCQSLKGEPGDEVFQMNIQFFQLTESPAEIGPRVDEGAGTSRTIARAETVLETSI